MLFEALGPTAFFLNAVVYGVSFLIYWRGVKDPAGEARGGRVAARRVRPLRRARPLVARPAAGADLDRGQRRRSACGSASRSSSSRRPNPAFPDQALMRGLRRHPDLARGDRHRDRLRGRACCTGATGSRSMRRTTIILLRDPRRRRARRRRAGRQPLGGLPLALLVGARSLVAGGRAVRAGRARRRRRSACWPTSPSASRPTAARSWASTRSSSRSARSPAPDRRVRGRLARHRRDADRDGRRCSSIALVPLARLRGQEHDDRRSTARGVRRRARRPA